MVAVGTQLGPYQILASLGAGGMGEVYRARHVRLGREVAVKVLPEPFAQDADRRARFEREARVVAALSHPNILAIHDYGTEQGLVFAVMELLEGETLGQRLGKSALPWRKALEIGVELAEGLAAAHAKGVIHRDLKPDNVFLTSDGRVKILDFGLARLEPGAAVSGETKSFGPGHTEVGTVMGTVGYMAPEQLRGRTIDARADIFSLGCILYEMIAGQRAFVRETVADTTAAVLQGEPPELKGSVLRAVPEADRLVRHCLEKNPEQRFHSARDLAFALRAVLMGSDVAKPAGSSKVRTRPAAPRRSKAIDSLAVLPFTNASTDANAEYLADGITESLIFSLSQLPKLRVMARSTVFRYKGKEVDAQAVGRDLKVRAVLSGRVMVLGDRLVLRTELVDVADGSQLWGEQYSRPLADIFAVQEKISEEITDKLRVKLTGADKKKLSKRATEDTEAYHLYLKGRFHWGKRTEESFRKGIDFFQQAIDRDPGYALAYAGLADCYNMLGAYGAAPPRDVFPKAEAAARKALDIDETLAEAHTSLAWLLHGFRWDWAGADREFRRAIELNPSYATAHHWYAYHLMSLGQFAEASARLKLAQEQDPLSLIINANVAFCLYLQRQYDAALEQVGKVLETDALFPVAHVYRGRVLAQKGLYDDAVLDIQKGIGFSGGQTEFVAILGHVYALAGKTAEAAKVRDDLAQLAGRRYVPPYHLAMVSAGLGDTEQALAALERAHGERDGFLTYLKVEPMLDRLRPDPRFADLLRRVGLDGERREAQPP
jgi:serine/threonine protein kinase/tetratricopeptide (TPR) repeat protein